MTRTELVRRLGPPLVNRMSIKEAQQKGFAFDPEDVGNDFFGGIFAWVQYGAQDRVISITFDLIGFANKFRGTQKILLMRRGRTCLLHGGLSQEEAQDMLAKSGLGLRVRTQGYSLVLKGTGTDLTFDTRKRTLRLVSLIELFGFPD